MPILNMSFEINSHLYSIDSMIFLQENFKVKGIFEFYVKNQI
jgi:hypothetical protein